MIKRIKKYDEIFENRCYNNKTCKELGINAYVYRAYIYTIESKSNILTFDDVIHESYVCDIAKELRKYKIHRIALTTCDVEILTEFDIKGITVDRMGVVDTPYTDWENNTQKTKNAIILEVQY